MGIVRYQAINAPCARAQEFRPPLTEQSPTVVLNLRYCRSKKISTCARLHSIPHRPSRIVYQSQGRKRAGTAYAEISDREAKSEPSTSDTLQDLDAVLGLLDAASIDDQRIPASPDASVSPEPPLQSLGQSPSVTTGAVYRALTEDAAEATRGGEDERPVRPWPVPWGALTVVAGLAGVELSYILAGILAPLLVISVADDAFWDRYLPGNQNEQTPDVGEEMRASGTTRAAVDEVLQVSPPLSDEGTLSAVSPAAVEQPREGDPVLLALQDVLEGPEYYRVLLTEMLLQLAMGSSFMVFLLQPFSPLPSSLFRISLSGGRSEEPETEAGSGAGSRSDKSDAHRRDEDGAGWVRAGLLGTAGVFLLVVLLTWLSVATGIREAGEGASSNGVIQRATEGGEAGVATLILCTCVFAPVFEEVFFRGFLLTSFTKWMPSPVAVLVSAAIFAALHLQGNADTVQLLAVGLVTGTVYCQTRNLAAPMFVHACFNAGGSRYRHISTCK
ncbi:hypothetical protein CYMTET_44823 [Cymbomonas tetramitiformis]|uniref:CAAX prenyl protease 2/Lysostaphin resistance protein A-like domain-containing protein n=1 Tax=Cymbomonas tetramitiformis TaxID=36881 RepID=A0AAE0BZG4_9CHLO|nr:hypothetical protein CYMTET_44823 [Cymbomonas tetramitiformis]